MRNKVNNFTADPSQRENATNKSIEKRKNDPNKTAGKKQAITRFVNNALFENPTRALYQNKHLDDAVADVIINEMFSITKEGDKSWIEEYAHNYLQEAKNDPKSNAANKIASALFNDNFVNQLQEYLSRQAEKDLDFYKYQIRTQLYDKQQNVFDDEIDKKHLIINSRRSGKTFLMGRLLAKNLLLQDAHCVYINRNSSAAIRQIKQPLEDAIHKIGLKCIKGSVENQEMYFENGSQLLIIGNNNASDVDKLRGERISCCIMDECGHQRNTRQLMREVIDPALKDYGKEARLYMVGTPPRNKGTYVEDVWNHAIERGWKLWHWTFMDNPAIPDRESVIEEVCKENGCDKDSAFIRREYFGEMNAYDSDALWIKKYVYNKDERIPNTPLLAYVGVDWGYEDKAAVVSIVASKQAQRGWIVNSWSESQNGIVEISNEIKRQVEYLKNNYNLEKEPMIICDNNEKGAVWDLFNTYKLRNVFTAYKYDLDYAEDQLNELFGTNKFMIVNDPSNRVLEDIENSMWKRDEESDRILHELDDEIWHPNALMAILYISRQFCFDVLGWFDHNKKARDIVEGRNND